MGNAGHDPSFIRRCVAALDRSRDAVLVATHVEIVHAGTGASWVHPFSGEAASADVTQRLRWVWREGGWTAIYGLIRREALARTRRMGSLPPSPWPGLGADYRDVVERADLRGQKYKDIADDLEVPIGTVMSRLFRARRVLEAELAGYAASDYGIKRAA